MISDRLLRTPQGANLQRGLIAMYPLLDAPALTVVTNTAPASSSIGNGTKVGTVSGAPGRLGMGWRTTPGGGISLGRTLPGGPFSFTFDVFFTSFSSSAQAGYLFADFTAAATNVSSRFAFGAYGTNWFIQVSDGTSTWMDTSQPIGLSLNTWYRFAITFSGNTIRLYVDGVLNKTWTSTIARSNSDGQGSGVFGRGGDWSGGWHSGVFSRIRVYNRVISDREVSLIAAESAIRDSAWNPSAKGTSVTLAMLNRLMTSTNAQSARGMVSMNSGKRMFEIVVAEVQVALVGVATSAATLASYPGYDTNGWSLYCHNGTKYHGGVLAYHGTVSPIGSVIGVAVDFTTGQLTFYRNGVSLGVAFTNLAGKTVFPSAGGGGAGYTPTFHFNSGEFGFAYPISGFDPWY